MKKVDLLQLKIDSADIDTVKDFNFLMYAARTCNQIYLRNINYATESVSFDALSSAQI